MYISSPSTHAANTLHPHHHHAITVMHMTVLAQYQHNTVVFIACISISQLWLSRCVLLTPYACHTELALPGASLTSINHQPASHLSLAGLPVSCIVVDPSVQLASLATSAEMVSVVAAPLVHASECSLVLMDGVLAWVGIQPLPKQRFCCAMCVLNRTLCMQGARIGSEAVG